MEQKYITTKAQSFQDNFEKYINKTSLWRMGESRYIGKMKENKFHFYYYPGYRNAWVTVLYGKLQGDTITYCFTKHRAVIVFSIIYSLFALLYFLILCIGGCFEYFPLIFVVVPWLPMLISTKAAKEKLQEMLYILSENDCPDNE